MKKRSFIPIASLVVLSGAAAVSGTFAWFQTTRSATVSFTDAQVKSRDSALHIDLDSSLNGLTASDPYSEFGNIVLDLTKAGADQFITDISGDGKNFYKIEQGYRKNENINKLDGVSWQEAVKINDIDLSADANGYLVDFTLSLWRTELTSGAGRPLGVYLGNRTKISAASGAAADVKAAKGARLSISTVAAGGVVTPIKLLAQTAEPATYDRVIGLDDQGDPVTDPGFDNAPLYTYLTKDAGGTAYGLGGYKVVAATNVLVMDDFDPDGANALPDLLTHNDASPAYLSTISGVGEANAIKLNFRMWLEGTDSDVGLDKDYNTAIGGKIELSLDLYTLHTIADQI